MSHLSFSILAFSTNFSTFVKYVAHFARNVEWDFLGDFQTPCVYVCYYWNMIDNLTYVTQQYVCNV